MVSQLIGKSLALGALSLATGIPGAGFAVNALPERDERQNQDDLQYKGRWNNTTCYAIDNPVGMDYRVKRIDKWKK